MPVSAPVSWEDLKKYVADGSIEALSNLGRSQADLDKYMEFKQTTLQEYKDMAEYVKISVFQPEVGVDENGKKVVTGPLQPGPEPKIIFRANDFPYWFDEGMEHHLLWSTQPLPEDEMLKQIEANRAGYEYVWFVNPAALQTIPELWHAHVISQPKQG